MLADRAVASFKRYPLLPFSERKALFKNLKGVERVVCQDTLSYKGIVAHGDNWSTGFQSPMRAELIESRCCAGAAIPDMRRGRLKKLPDMPSRFRIIDDIMGDTTKPIISDGDAGGLAEYFVYTVCSLE